MLGRLESRLAGMLRNLLVRATSARVACRRVEWIQADEV
jgi:hypothetical protein